uniref:NMDA receptor synaptonuclear signaling and neuronal migration factor-like isoform X2 n=1 Tax=Doryrhamphus excisus TaxID=161450 RepID=UPI0025AE946B|nr:NMDA receptor synaptonuclear signaling and neuronal migration factor-like isoform X2 [Doryrhamphus excisus]
MATRYSLFDYVRVEWSAARVVGRVHLSMGTSGSKRKNLRTDAVSSVAAKVRAARAFGEYVSNTNPENRNRSDQLLSDSFRTQDCDSPGPLSCLHNNNLPPQSRSLPATKSSKTEHPDRSDQIQSQPQAKPLQTQAPLGPSKRRLSAARSLSTENPPGAPDPEGRGAGKPARVYTITKEVRMTLGPGSDESLELDILKSSKDDALSQTQNHKPSFANQQILSSVRGSHHRGNHHHSHKHREGPLSSSQSLQNSDISINTRDLGMMSKGGSDSGACIHAPCQSQRSLDLDTSPWTGGKHLKKLERMYSEDGASTGEKDDHPNSWFPKENMFSFQTATTTMQAAFRGIAEKKRRKREQEAATVMERNFRKHLRMVGSRRIKVQTFVDRRAKSFSRSWSDPTPVNPDSLHDSRDSGDLQTSSGTLNEGLDEDADWADERQMERIACEGEDFIPPKIILISSKVPKAEYVPNIIRRDDPSIIPILYDHEHATFDDILEEIEKKLTAYRKGCKIWNMLIFCQGGPGHLYLLKNKVATFAKVEKEEDMIHFWRRLGRLMSKLNPEPNLIHIMGCYVLGSANGEKLIQTLKRLMRPSCVEFKSPLELSAQGKEMIEMYFNFRLFRLWKSRQHSKMMDYDDLL